MKVDLLYFVFRDDATPFGGPYLDQALAKRMAQTWADADGERAIVVGVPVIYLAQHEPNADDTPE